MATLKDSLLDTIRTSSQMTLQGKVASLQLLSRRVIWIRRVSFPHAAKPAGGRQMASLSSPCDKAGSESSAGTGIDHWFRGLPERHPPARRIIDRLGILVPAVGGRHGDVHIDIWH